MEWVVTLEAHFYIFLADTCKPYSTTSGDVSLSLPEQNPEKKWKIQSYDIFFALFDKRNNYLKDKQSKTRNKNFLITRLRVNLRPRVNIGIQNEIRPWHVCQDHVCWHHVCRHHVFQDHVMFVKTMWCFSRPFPLCHGHFMFV